MNHIAEIIIATGQALGNLIVPSGTVFMMILADRRRRKPKKRKDDP